MKTQRQTRRNATQQIRALFAEAHAEGRAVISTEEFQLRASLAGLSDRDVRDAISGDVLRRGLTGYWLREAPDPGALVVFANAMIDCMRNRRDDSDAA